jgi:hypothetical protein
MLASSVVLAASLVGSARAEGTDMTPPTAPTNLTPSGVTQTAMAFVWTKSSDNVAVSGYELWLDGVKQSTTTLNFGAYWQLKCGQAYDVAIIAYDAAGNKSLPAKTTASTSGCDGSTAPAPSPSPPAGPRPSAAPPSTRRS